MTSVFISYSVKDEDVAQSLYNSFTAAGIKTFMASISIKAGEDWTESIFKNLKSADWIFFLASKNSINSQAVQQELGASLMKNKIIIPILLDIGPEELPGWVSKHQAIDLKSAPEKLQHTISAISKKVQSNDFWQGVLLGAVVIAGAVFLFKPK